MKLYSKTARFCMASLLAIYEDRGPYKKLIVVFMIFVDVSKYIEAVLTTKNDH